MTKLIAKMPPRKSRDIPGQLELKLPVEKQIEHEGIGMGVLKDGTPFLNQRGLGILCDVRNKYIGQISSDWNSDRPGERTEAIRKIVNERGQDARVCAYETYFGRQRVLAYPDYICRLCCTNPVRDSSCESSVVAGRHEQTHTPRLQDSELARL
jgi:hypothetical protein